MDVHANSDDEEIFFFSNEFDADKSINGSENFKLFVDEKEKPFKTSMKLKAGEQKIAILFNNSLLSCQNMFRNCKNIIGVRINTTNDCNNICLRVAHLLKLSLLQNLKIKIKLNQWKTCLAAVVPC